MEKNGLLPDVNDICQKANEGLIRRVPVACWRTIVVASSNNTQGCGQLLPDEIGTVSNITVPFYARLYNI